jgi:hypothetical protein
MESRDGLLPTFLTLGGYRKHGWSTAYISASGKLGGVSNFAIKAIKVKKRLKGQK